MRNTDTYCHRRHRLALLLPLSILFPLTAWSQAPPPSSDPHDEPSAIWSPAYSGNFRVARRPEEFPIEYVVIHDIEGSAESAVAWFRNPQARVSAHYVVGSGKLWQQVRERDVAFHAGNTRINERSIGVEHDGFAYRPGYFDSDVYETSARLVRSITTRRGIPRDRQHIIAHAEVPDPTDPARFGGRNGHTDPGPWWDWDYYMTLVRSEAEVLGFRVPEVIRPGEKLSAVVTVRNKGDDPWPALARRGRSPDAETQGPVYLGVRAATDLVRAASPFHDSTTWISPSYAAPPPSPASPGDVAAFALTLQGPRELGQARESFRLVRVPPAPHRPVPFGPSLSMNLRVVPWEFVQELDAPGFAAPGWETRERDGRRVRSVRWQSAELPVPASWSLTLPTDGEWEIQARWPGGREGSRAAVYEIGTADGPVRITVDQRRGVRRDDWRILGRVRLRGVRPTLAVTLGADRDGRVDAEALRVTGPFPPETR